MFESHLKSEVRKHAEKGEPALAALLLGLERARELDSEIGESPVPNNELARLASRYPESKAPHVVVDSDTKKVSIKLGIRDAETIGEVLKQIGKGRLRTRMLYSSALLNLTSCVELFFSQLLHAYFTLHPEAIGTKEKIFSFDDLSDFSSIEEARAHYVLARIEELLRGSLADWLAFAKNTLKISMGYLEEDTALLEESFQRRNVIVHNGGLANSIYISKVRSRARSGISLNDDLTPDRHYLNHRIDLWERACILIASELWKKLDASDDQRGRSLLEIGYRHLTAKRWSVAESLCTFLVGDKQQPEDARLSAQVNVWLCKKESGDWECERPAVSSSDFSAKGHRFQLARLALLDETEKFYELLPVALASDQLTREELSEFPVFAPMRADARYAEYAGKEKKEKRSRRRKTPTQGGA
ncbi:MAG: hypothetical protein IBJ19_02140 [Gemmatimonadaceae bacterium]|nr:hypothetical protein [Gemmatimonadaceae bacterium]